MGGPSIPSMRRDDRAVVEEAQVVVAVLGEQRVRLVDVDLAAEQLRELAVACARASATRAGPGSARRAGPGCPRRASARPGSRPSSGTQSPVRRFARRRSPRRSRPRRCRRSGRAGGRRPITWASRRPDMITTSTPARWQASSARACMQREVPLGVAEQRARGARAGCRRGRCRRSAGTRPAQRYTAVSRATLGADDRLAPRRPTARVPAAARGRDRQRHRRLVLRGRAQRHARSGRSRTAWRWPRPGFDLLDVGAVPARSGPPVAGRRGGRAARPGDRGAGPARRACR